MGAPIVAALEGLLRHYVQLVESGDAGFWNPHEEPVVIAARAALDAHYASPLIGDPTRDAFRESAMRAAEDEALRDASPHRFNDTKRTVSKL